MPACSCKFVEFFVLVTDSMKLRVSAEKKFTDK
jgi:hypothetical protein